MCRWSLCIFFTEVSRDSFYKQVVYSYLQNSLYTNRSLLFSLCLSLPTLDVDLMATLQHTFKGGAEEYGQFEDTKLQQKKEQNNLSTV